jgi:hypothetical protein
MFEGKVGGSGSGYELEILQSLEKPRGFIGLKGGLGDARSDSLFSFAEQIVERSDGEFAVGLIATTRPTNIVKAIRGNPELARRRRSQSVYGAVRHAVGWLEPEQVILGGHSQGGISMIDGVAHALRQPKKHLPANTQVMTFDTPSIFGPIEYEGTAVEALLRLGLHCVGDLARIPNKTLQRMVTGNMFKRSSFEPLYFTREARYLINDLDVGAEVDFVRNVYPIYHVYHRQDVVPGAEHEGRDFVRVFDGGHLEMLTHEGMEPVVQYILEVASSHRNQQDVA